MKILVGYDGTAQAKVALEVAKKHAQAFKAEVYVVTSLTGETETTTEAIKQAQAELEDTKEFFAESGIPVELHLLYPWIHSGGRPRAVCSGTRCGRDRGGGEEDVCGGQNYFRVQRSQTLFYMRTAR